MISRCNDKVATTIKQLLSKYDITVSFLLSLKKKGIVNGCGGKGGICFSCIIENNIKLLPEYLQDKACRLLYNLDLLCYFHDYGYYCGGNYFNKVLLDIEFCNSLYKLLNWTNLFNRILIWIIVFIGLLFKGNRFYNFK